MIIKKYDGGRTGCRPRESGTRRQEYPGCTPVQITKTLDDAVRELDEAVKGKLKRQSRGSAFVPTRP
jgi:hypothetical protein